MGEKTAESVGGKRPGAVYMAEAAVMNQLGSSGGISLQTKW